MTLTLTYLSYPYKSRKKLKHIKINIDTNYRPTRGTYGRYVSALKESNPEWQDKELVCLRKSSYEKTGLMIESSRYYVRFSQMYFTTLNEAIEIVKDNAIDSTNFLIVNDLVNTWVREGNIII